MKALVALVADANMEAALDSILMRAAALGIRSVERDIFRHPRRDPGVLTGASEFLRPFVDAYHHALVMFDRHGCGHEEQPASDLQHRVESELNQAGWAERAAAIVLDPELENWVWSDSPHVGEVLGADEGELRQLVAQQTTPGNAKPAKPKELLEEVLRRSRIPRSSSLYAELARRVSLERCTDPAFQRLKSILRAWFASDE